MTSTNLKDMFNISFTKRKKIGRNAKITSDWVFIQFENIFYNRKILCTPKENAQRRSKAVILILPFVSTTRGINLHAFNHISIQESSLQSSLITSGCDIIIQKKSN